MCFDNTESYPNAQTLQFQVRPGPSCVSVCLKLQVQMFCGEPKKNPLSVYLAGFRVRAHTFIWTDVRDGDRTGVSERLPSKEGFMSMLNRNFARLMMMGVFSLGMRKSAVSGSGRRQWFFFWGRDGKRRHRGPWSSSYVSLHVVPSNRQKFMYLCSVSYVVGVIRTLQGWSGLLDPRTKSLSFCDDKHFPTSWKREGHGFLAMEFKSFYNEIQDTQVDLLHQDASVRQPSALNDLLGGSTCMHGCRCRQCGDRAECLHESAAGAPWHRPSHVVEESRARVPSPGPDGQAAPGCSWHFCISWETLQQCGARKEWLAG